LETIEASLESVGKIGFKKSPEIEKEWETPKNS
jgi:hypothetical protein